ncbi:Aste57867_4048 [Aphanomyces stellatus]|uniref:Aste57867_4048 protein n=1 Tax=Aphanomyces stellatus TaxID=120398 RepID=A0A485KGF1_9STRA|nr:hypothetical protein As57867_004037 [Aphanomyces stellatus]VFT81182.1 Aste57867_4048 [Aphanomyces stellatus]
MAAPSFRLLFKMAANTLCRRMPSPSTQAVSATRIEERERRVYKDAHAAQFAKIRHFPALSQVNSSGDNVILLQDTKNTDPVLSATQARMERIQSRIHAPDTFQALLGPKSMLQEFRHAVLCKHSNARASRADDDDDASPNDQTTSPRHRFDRPPKPVFNTGNPSEAKTRIARPRDYDYPTGIHSRDERVIAAPQQERIAEANVLHNKAMWAATNANSAKKAIQVDQFMNSPLPNAVPLDRKYVKQLVRLHAGGGAARLDEALASGRRPT